MRSLDTKSIDQKLEATRHNLGMIPDSIVDPSIIYIDRDLHSWEAEDGSRWSSLRLVNDRNTFLASAGRNPAIAMVA